MTVELIARTTPEAITANRKTWLAALRSGAYDQAKSRLYDGTGYCCLGLACEIAGVPMGAVELEWEDQPRYTFGAGGDEYLTLPPEGREWLGLTSQNPTLDFPEELLSNDCLDESEFPSTVAGLNDAGFTFDQIADLIEYFGFTADEDVLQGARSEPW